MKRDALPDRPGTPNDEAPPPETALFQRICRHIEAHRDENISLDALAAMAGLSAGHFQRRFKAIMGISPRQYAEACRLDHLKQGLRQGSNITDAIYEAGFGSGSRVYEKLDTRLGMTPGQYRHGGQGLAISYAVATSSLGPLMMAATDRGLCFVQFGKPAPELLEILQAEYPKATISAMPDTAHPPFTAWMQALEAYLKDGQPVPRLPDIPLDILGTAFRTKVWRYLQSIPYGETRSYTQVAEAIGQPKAARAVASACAANNLAILIPCHRVIRGSGELGGYRWGLPVKRALLAQEQHLRPQSCL